MLHERALTEGDVRLLKEVCRRAGRPCMEKDYKEARKRGRLRTYVHGNDLAGRFTREMDWWVGPINPSCHVIAYV